MTEEREREVVLSESIDPSQRVESKVPEPQRRDNKKKVYIRKHDMGKAKKGGMEF